jgi:hypothetical protein
MTGWQVNDEETTTNIHALSGIRTNSLSFKAIKAYASDNTATGSGTNTF